MSKNRMCALLGGMLVFGLQSASASPLAIVTNNALQQIEVEVGPVEGEVRVYGVSTIPSGTLFTGITEIFLTTGLAQDYVEFRVFSEVVPAIDLNTSAGNSDVKIIYFSPETLATVSSSVVVRGGSAEDKVNFTVESLSAGFAADWTVLGGGGTNELTAVVNAPEVSDLLSLDVTGDFLGGSDTVDVAVTADAASAVINLAAYTRGGNDTVKLSTLQLSSGATSANYDVQLGAGLDTADLALVSGSGAIDAAGNILGGGSDDQLKYSSEGSGSLDVTFDGGANADNIDVFAKGTVTGSPRLLGGFGNDFLKIVVDGPQIATPLLDGGPGIDGCLGFGTIINCEQ